MDVVSEAVDFATSSHEQADDRSATNSAGIGVVPSKLVLYFQEALCSNLSERTVVTTMEKRDIDEFGSVSCLLFFQIQIQIQIQMSTQLPFIGPAQYDSRVTTFPIDCLESANALTRT